MFGDNKLLRYLNNHISPEDNLMDQLEKETYLKTINPRMISGKIQGEFLTFLCKILQPKTILEIGTFTGYSAISMAKGSGGHATIYSIDYNKEWQLIANTWIEKAGFSNKIKLLNGKAQEIIPTLNVMFDLVFVDGEKDEYIDCYNLVFPKWKTRGFLLVDNVLWNGKIFDKQAAKTDKKTKHILKFNQMIQDDNRVNNFILPIRDGLMVIEKIR